MKWIRLHRSFVSLFVFQCGRAWNVFYLVVFVAKYQCWLKNRIRQVKALKLFLGSVRTCLHLSCLLSWAFSVAKRMPDKMDGSWDPASPPALWFEMKHPPLCPPHSQHPSSTFVVEVCLQFQRWSIPSSCEPPETCVKVDGNLRWGSHPLVLTGRWLLSFRSFTELGHTSPSHAKPSGVLGNRHAQACKEPVLTAGRIIAAGSGLFQKSFSPRNAWPRNFLVV